MKKILLIQTASIGDVILITPALENVHASFPDAEIDILVKKGCESLFAGHPYVNKLHIWNKNTGKYCSLFKIIKQIRNEKYNAVITFQRFFTSGLITVLSGAAFKSGFNKNPLSFLFTKRIKHQMGNDKQVINESDRNLQLISLLTGNTEGKVRLYPSTIDFDAVSQYKIKKYICVAPASLWFTKQLPEAKWAEFIRLLKNDIKVYFIGSKSDISKCNDIIKLSGCSDYEILCGGLSFLESAALMKDALMNFANDSSPVHLASAVNAPVTVVYCSTVPDFGFRPLSDKSYIVQTKETLNCRPCGIHGYNSCPEKHFKCALSVDIVEMINKIPV